jgi:hypothetical protein
LSLGTGGESHRKSIQVLVSVQTASVDGNRKVIDGQSSGLWSAHDKSSMAFEE